MNPSLDSFNIVRTEILLIARQYSATREHIYSLTCGTRIITAEFHSWA